MWYAGHTVKPHPKLRKTIKWGGAAATVLLAVVWIGSGWRSVEWMRGDWSFGLTGGSLFVGDRQILARGVSDGVYSGVLDSLQSPRWRWWCSTETPYLARNIYVPLWMPSLGMFGVCLSACALDTLARRRARGSLCPRCSYDRTGLAKNAACPECGKPHLPESL
jgi:hypothetical protein